MKRDPLERGAGDVGLVGAASEPGDRAARVRVPVGCTQAGEGWHEVHATVVGYAPGQPLDLGRRLDDAQFVAQPLCHGTGDEHAAFKRILSLVANFPCDRTEQFVAGRHRLVAGVHEHEAAGAVGVFHHAGLVAALAKESGVLVAGNARDGDRLAKRPGLGVRLA